MCDFSLHHVKSRPAKVGDKRMRSRRTASRWRSVGRFFLPHKEAHLTHL
jgi:hypothetical protein